MNEHFALYLKALEETERLSLPHLALYQEQLLQRLVLHARDNVPFYRDRLACLFDADGSSDLSRWNEIPILERTDVVSNGAAMRVASLAESYGQIMEIHTSGTTGTPLSTAANALVSVSANAMLMRVARWFGLNPTRPLASIRVFKNIDATRYPEGRTGKGWSFSYPDSAHYALHVMTPIEQQLEWLARKKAPYLFTYPSNAMALADAVSSKRGRELGIEMVFAIAETVPDGARELIAERLGARLAGIYACQEIGAIASECETAPHYHVAAENALVEIVDENGRDVAPGERGRVVITGLYNYAMPYIRYAIGDVAVAGTGPCGCGRSLPVIERVEGRIRNAFIFRDGTRVWPRGWLAREMRAFVPFQQYQMVQLDHERIEFRYIPDGSGREPDLAGLSAYARKMMHPSVEMTVVAMDALPRGPSGKFEDFMSLVSAALTPPRSA